MGGGRIKEKRIGAMGRGAGRKGMGLERGRGRMGHMGLRLGRVREWFK